MVENLEKKVIECVERSGEASSREIFDSISTEASYATVKRTIARLLDENLLSQKGRGKSTKYLLSPAYRLLVSVDIEQYFEQEIDQREIKTTFEFSLLSDTLARCSAFTAKELAHLNTLQARYTHTISHLSATEYSKELERLAIDLSWKSSQIEGNTYSLLETERLLKEKMTAAGKTKEEAIMLLNHKHAIDFIIEHPDYLVPLAVSKIEDIHGLLTKDLEIGRNIRKRRVGISGTNYCPLDNEFQILEALSGMCELVNSKNVVFEKALLLLVLISYIQPFIDGNKRTARIVSNAVLMNYKHCPISFRTVDSIEYKKAMLLFYEQNNISKCKEIFIEQFEFAVDTYF